MSLLSSLFAKLVAEPEIVAGVLAAGVVLLAGHFGIVLDKPTVTSVLTPIVVGIALRLHPKNRKK